MEAKHSQAPWYFLPDENEKIVQRRLKEQLPIFQKFGQQSVSMRIGQCLEIAVHRGLMAQNQLEYLGGFSDLDDHDDNKLYSKEEPPSLLNGKRIPGKRKLDFLVREGKSGWAGVEVKNVRPWIYPHSEEISDLIEKFVLLDCVPVLIARRIHYVTFKVLSVCGVIVHQTYNQLLPSSEASLAAEAAEKTLLGYHDIRIGNLPDKRLLHFLGTNLPAILPEAREKFNNFKDLLEGYANNEYDYPEFAARVRRRAQGTKEDNDWPEPEPPDDDQS